MSVRKLKFKIEEKQYAQVRYYETLYKIYDDNGEVLFVGSEETARRILGKLNKTPTAKPKRKAKR